MFRENLWAYCLIAVYACFVSAVAIALGRPQNIPGFGYLSTWVMVPALLAVGFTAFSVVAAVRAGESFRDFAARLRHLTQPPVLSGMALFLALGFFQGSFTAMKTMMPLIAPFSWDPFLADVDAMLHGGDAWRLLPHSEIFTRLLLVAYLPLWIALLVVVNLQVCLLAERETRARYLKTFFFCWIFLGNVLALAFMSAGPIFFEQVTGDARFDDLLRYFEFTRDMPSSNLNVADYLWSAYAGHDSAQGSGISAFPSLHLAMATLWTATFWKMRPRLGYILAGYTVLILIGSIHLGWHYAIDGYASIALTLAAWWLFGKNWSGREDSNLRPLPPEDSALPG